MGHGKTTCATTRCATRDTVESNLKSIPPHEGALFHFVMEGMIDDYGEHSLVTEQGFEEMMHDRLSSALCWRRKFDHVSTNRFFGVLRRFELYEDRLWHSRLYGLIAACLELGIVTESSLSATIRAVKPKPRGETETPARSTAKAVLNS